MIFDLEEKKSGAWFELPEGRAGKVKVRRCTGEDLQSIINQTSKKSVEYKRIEGKAERFAVVDEDLNKRQEMFWDFAIEEWEGILDKNSNPIPCDYEHKNLMIRRVVKPFNFAEFIGQCLKKLEEDEAAEAAALEKNDSTTSSMSTSLPATPVATEIAA